MSDKSGKASNKIRKSLSLSEETVERGKQVAKAEHRTFSNLVDALVDREYQRQFPAEAAREQLELLRAKEAA